VWDVFLLGGPLVSRTLSTLQAILLGLLLLAGVGLIGATVFAVGSRKWFGSDALHIRAGFPSVQGVEIGTKVRIRGMDAGEVVSVETPESTEAAVELRLRVHGKFRHLVRKNATVQIVSVGMLGGKAVEINPGTEKADPVEDDAVLKSKPTTELTDVLEQVRSTLDSVVEGQGTVGKLARDPQAYDALVGTLKSIQGAAHSIQADAEAVKKVPLLGGYVEDPRALLDRPGHERNRKWFREAALFEPGRAVLTRQGKAELDGLGSWFEGLNHSGSEVVVVAYADPASPDPAAARKLTQEQSKAVLEYLREKHKVQKLGFLSWRTVTALGMGVNPSPTKEREKLPAPRVEVLIFVPQE
jgi:hypothetical protein